MAFCPDTATVVAARAGDPVAVDRLVADCLPLVYTIVGRALEGHADVDDVVQETMLRVLRSLGDLRDPEAFRSWLVAITVRQVRTRDAVRRAAPDSHVPDEVRDPGADFTDVAIARLELAGQRRETAEATRWLDPDHREVLSLWWLETSGQLSRDEVVSALGVTRQHAAVRIQRMKAQLQTARVVVRALAAVPPCSDLVRVADTWDGRPGALWRKRIARHVRLCRTCTPARGGMVGAEALLHGMALVPVPYALTVGGGHLVRVAAGTHATSSVTTGTGTGTSAAIAAAGTAGVAVGRRVLTALLVTGAVVGGGAVAESHQGRGRPPAPAAVVAAQTTNPRPSAPATSAAPVVPATAPAAPPADAPAPPVAEPPAQPAPEPAVPVAPAPATLSPKKGAATWQFDGIYGALSDVGAGWYYNWSPSNDTMPGPAGVEFVPMIWGRDAVTDATLARARGEGTVLLGFNEPDLAEQAGMSVEEALDLWPRLEATGMRLGSPAVAYGADTPGGWLDRFMAGARERNLRVDFITLHWYGSDFSDAAVGHFLGYVDAVHQRYGLPVWVTEYGLMSFSGSPRHPTGAQAAAFIAGTTQGMQARSYVERYAWFGLPAVGDSVEFGLYRDATTPTEAGAAYRAAGG